MVASGLLGLAPVLGEGGPLSARNALQEMNVLPLLCHSCSATRGGMWLMEEDAQSAGSKQNECGGGSSAWRCKLPKTIELKCYGLGKTPCVGWVSVPVYSWS